MGSHRFGRPQPGTDRPEFGADEQWAAELAAIRREPGTNPLCLCKHRHNGRRACRHPGCGCTRLRRPVPAEDVLAERTADAADRPEATR